METKRPHKGHREEGRLDRARRREQLQARRRDHPERALGADEQVAQVVAGVVLAQALEAVPHLALRRDHFEAQAQVARIAVAHHLRAACVGAQVAANGAAALGSGKLPEGELGVP